MVQPGKNLVCSRSVPAILSPVDVSERDVPACPIFVVECSSGVLISERSVVDWLPSVVVSSRHVLEIESNVGRIARQTMSAKA